MVRKKTSADAYIISMTEIHNYINDNNWWLRQDKYLGTLKTEEKKAVVSLIISQWETHKRNQRIC